jgi:hypothetical protein
VGRPTPLGRVWIKTPGLVSLATYLAPSLTLSHPIFEYTIARVDTLETWELVTAESGSCKDADHGDQADPFFAFGSIDRATGNVRASGRPIKYARTYSPHGFWLLGSAPADVNGGIIIYRATHPMPTPVQLL